MSKLVIAIAALVCACGTKQNPRACCTDPADCMNVGLPVGTDCDEGLLCRGNRCVEDPCSSSAECDVTAPYCIETDEGRCAEACTIDVQCPGFGQTAEQTFCVDGGCVECRAGMNDCPASAPICSTAGMCVTCEAHTDCGSGVCANGMCTSESEVAYVALDGSATSDCTRSEPCSTIQRALTVAVNKPYVLIAVGTYTTTTAISPTGTRWLIGREGRPVLTRSTDGPVIDVTGTVNIKLERLEVFGAKGLTSPDVGAGIRCSSQQGAPTLELLHVFAHSNALDGLNAIGCVVNASQSEFSRNTFEGIDTGEGSSTYDRILVLGNGRTGMFLDGGIHAVTNSIIARNAVSGIDIYSNSGGSRIEFNTIVDNGTAGDAIATGVQCAIAGGIVSNNVIVRNVPNQVLGSCSYPNTIIDPNIGPLKFRSPDAPPYDYHIQPGSSAIDLGGIATTKHDIDGESRPSGAGFDIGADELH